MNVYRFGRILLEESQVFFESRFSFGSVNLKPLLPGHTLVVSRRCAPRLIDLPPEEAADLFLSARIIGTTIFPPFFILFFLTQKKKKKKQTHSRSTLKELPSRLPSKTVLMLVKLSSTSMSVHLHLFISVVFFKDDEN